MDSDSSSDSFVRLLSAHEPQIRGLIMLLVTDWNDAQDIMQKVSIVLWSKFSSFRRDTSFLAWAIVIAKLEVKNHFRRQNRERDRFSDQFFDVIDHHSNSMSEELEHRRKVLGLCLKRLKPKDREMLQLRYYEETSISEIAKAVGRSSDAVYKALERLRRALVDCVRRRVTEEGFS